MTRNLVAAVGSAPAVAACGKNEPAPAPKPDSTAAATPSASAPAVDSEPGATYPTGACFGNTHVHTGWLADAGVDGATLTPEDAYRFARGEEVKSNSGLPAKLGRPYDWFMITDHLDGMGVISELVAGNPEMMDDSMLKRWRDALTSGDE